MTKMISKNDKRYEVKETEGVTEQWGGGQGRVGTMFFQFTQFSLVQILYGNHFEELVSNSLLIIDSLIRCSTRCHIFIAQLYVLRCSLFSLIYALCNKSPPMAFASRKPLEYLRKGHPCFARWQHIEWTSVLRQNYMSSQLRVSTAQAESGTLRRNLSSEFLQTLRVGMWQELELGPRPVH